MVVNAAEPDDTKKVPEGQPPPESQGRTPSDEPELEPSRKPAGKRTELTRYELLKRNFKLLERDYDAMEEEYRERLAQKDADLRKLEGVREKRERQLQQELSRLSNNLVEQEKRFEADKKNYLTDRDNRQAELEKLRILHIKSVNSVDPGLEPILDDQLREKFVAIHSEV